LVPGPFNLFLAVKIKFLATDTLLLSEYFLIVKGLLRVFSMNFDDCLDRLRKYYKQSNAEIEKFLGLSNGYISKIEKNPGKLFLALSEKGISLDWFLTGEGQPFVNQTLGAGSPGAVLGYRPPNLASIPKPIKIYNPSDIEAGAFVVPLLDQRLSAGPGAALPEADEVKALIPVPGYLRQYGENIAALTVDGDSMEPTLRRGDMVVCDSLGWSGEGIYAVRMGGSGFVKRITKRPGKVVVLSDNPKYPPQEEPEGSEDFTIIGRVHCAITKVE
jgi:phage repressor protein C with HTH and peptisase S24 domain